MLQDQPSTEARQHALVAPSSPLAQQLRQGTELATQAATTVLKSRVDTTPGNIHLPGDWPIESVRPSVPPAVKFIRPGEDLVDVEN
jgi:hypothetical protein